MTLQQVISE